MSKGSPKPSAGSAEAPGPPAASGPAGPAGLDARTGRRRARATRARVPAAEPRGGSPVRTRRGSVRRREPRPASGDAPGRRRGCRRPGHSFEPGPGECAQRVGDGSRRRCRRLRDRAGGVGLRGAAVLSRGGTLAGQTHHPRHLPVRSPPFTAKDTRNILMIGPSESGTTRSGTAVGRPVRAAGRSGP